MRISRTTTGGLSSRQWTMTNHYQGLSPFATDKALKCAIETVKSIKCLRSGDLLVEVGSASQSRSLNKINNLAGSPVTASPHHTLNTCIRCRALIDCPKDKILEELKSQGITNIYNILTKDDSGNRRNTNTFIVTFHTASISKHIKIGYLRIPVELYIPNPLRCFNCQKFGHGKKTCKAREICTKCGQAGHNGSPCSNETKCPNCAGDHTAFSKECPKWVFEKRVQWIKAENSISFAEARKAAAGENESRPFHDTRTAAEVVRIRSEPPPPATRPIKTQTDLTWPVNQDTPITVPTSTYTSETVYTLKTQPNCQIRFAITKPDSAKRWNS